MNCQVTTSIKVDVACSESAADTTKRSLHGRVMTLALICECPINIMMDVRETMYGQVMVNRLRSAIHRAALLDRGVLIPDVLNALFLTSATITSHAGVLPGDPKISQLDCDGGYVDTRPHKSTAARQDGREGQLSVCRYNIGGMDWAFANFNPAPEMIAHWCYAVAVDFVKRSIAGMTATWLDECTVLRASVSECDHDSVSFGRPTHIGD